MSWDKERVRQLRQRLGLTQSEFAGILGCRQQTISEWEQGLYLPANAYGKLLEQMSLQVRIKPFENPRSHSVVSPKDQIKEIAIDREDVENSFDKSFDPGID